MEECVSQYKKVYRLKMKKKLRGAFFCICLSSISPNSAQKGQFLVVCFYMSVFVTSWYSRESCGWPD